MSEEMKNGCFRVPAEPKVNRRATVIGDENVYTNSGFRGDVERHRTNWTYLLTVSEETYPDEPYYPKEHPSMMNDAKATGKMGRRSAIH